MGVSWTEEQQQVISLRNRNLLVAAAAGSGKTAVLVERIIKKITDETRPVDIDRLLVVTFTKAAAAEMRERIRIAIEKLQQQDPENENLARQASLIHNAQISTIDSFCLFVVRNHFGEIGLDPNFRIAEQGEIQLLEQDVMSELLEQEYVLERAGFLRLVDAYSGKRNDQAIRDMIEKIYHASSSCPWPEKWIAGLAGPYQCSTEEELLAQPLLQDAASELRRKLEGYAQKLQEYRELASGEKGVAKYVARLEQDVRMFSGLPEKKDLAALTAFLKDLDLPSLPTITKKDQADPDTKNRIHTGRNAIKDELKKLKEEYAAADPAALLAQTIRLRPVVEELVRLTLRYTEMLAQEKQKRRIADFADIEHFALQILVDPESGKPTRTAEEFRRHYEEIMIDEYQDSNQVQEEILMSISGQQEGIRNVFMVGDVKQSIYRFRQARPELFMEKYARYTAEDGPEQKIELHRNFRSRSQVLDFTNDMFYKLMAPNLGGVAYDEAAALYPGASYPEASDMQAEVILLDQSSLENLMLSEDEAAAEEDKQRLEARLVASRIRQLMKTGSVTDKASGKLRPVRYSDIVILLRSLKGWDNAFSEVLESWGIPVHVESSTGYFSAWEVQTVLNFLRILDNPLQDIPMTAVLHSPIAGLDEEDLAQIRVEHKDLSFAAACLQEMESEQPGRLTEFGSLYRRLRAMTAEVPVHELIQNLLRETGFADYAGSMPMGAKRLANLDMLVQKAIGYERTSYKGLFHFIRYIDQLQKYDVDYGEADVTGENADVVHIMTIHKSKGLEFPIVFVSSLSKQFNTGDVKDTLVLHPDRGLGIPEMTLTPKLRRESLFRRQISEQITRENMGEELRVLYVALTRAKEKLILTGLISDREKLYEKFSGNVIPHQALDYEVRRGAKSYAEWILPAVLSYPDRYQLTFAEPEELVLESAEETVRSERSYEQLKRKIKGVPEEEAEKIRRRLSWIYPHSGDNRRKSKYSVSELKHAAMTLQYDRTEGEAEVPDFLKREHESYVPYFAEVLSVNTEDNSREGSCASGGDTLGAAEKEQTPSAPGTYGVSGGALRGTAVHRVMECLDFAALGKIDRTDPAVIRRFVTAELQRMCSQQELTEDMRKRVPAKMIEQFAVSEAAGRMARAAQEGLLFKEKPFVMSYRGPVSAEEAETESYDPVLVQGIIDVFWMEGNDIILLDYKTDRISEGQELVLRYQKQLELYADALERIFTDETRKMQVTEKILYSFALQEEITI